MFKIRFNPTWLMVTGFVASAVGIAVAPGHRSFFILIMAIIGVFLFLNVVMWLKNLLDPPPVPDSAVRLLLKRCKEGQDPDEWAIAEFTPRVSLKEARSRVGSDTYSQEDRVKSFMMKFNMLAASRPATAIFYSTNKGVAVAKVGPVNALLKKHGEWKLNTWNCLVGALRMKGMTVASLDGPQGLPLA